MGRKHKFPNPSDVKPSNQAVLCPADHILALYNEGAGDSAKRIAQKVRKWFYKEAHKKGWAGIRFLKDVQSGHGAGCILWIPPRQVNMIIELTNQMLVLENSEDEG